MEVSFDSGNSITELLRDRVRSLIKTRAYEQGTNVTTVVGDIATLVDREPETVFRWLREDSVNDKYHDRIARFFNVTTEWLLTGKGEKYVRDTPTVNTPRGIDLQGVGNTGLTMESHAGESISDKITTLYELVYSLIPMQEMKNALERGDEVKTPFRFIFERDFEGDTYEVKFIAEVRKIKKPSPPTKDSPTTEKQ